MDDFVLTEPERTFLAELRARAVPYMVVGLTAAALQGANLTTVDIELWFPTLENPQLDAAARAAGGFLVSGFGMMPAMLGGPLSDRFDIVTHMSGLGSFAEEAAHARRVTVDQVELDVLALSPPSADPIPTTWRSSPRASRSTRGTTGSSTPWLGESATTPLPPERRRVAEPSS